MASVVYHMTPLPLIKQLKQPAFSRKFVWLLILATLISVSVIIIPRVETQSPAVESKMLALRMLLATIFVAGVANLRTLLRPKWQFTDFLFAALALSFIISTLASGRIMYSLVEAWHLGAFFCLAWLIYRLRPTFQECAGIAWLGGAIGLLAGLYGFLTFIGLDVLRALYPFDIEQQQGGRNLIHSFYGNPEYFGGYAAPTAVLLLGLGFQPDIKRFLRIVLIGSAAFLVGVLALSGSRGSLLGFAIGSGLVFIGQIGFLSRRMQKACWAASGVAFLLVIAGLTILSTPNLLNPKDMRLIQRFEDVFNTQSDSIRERILFYTTTALAIPLNPVLGYGPGSYRLEFFNNVKLLVEIDERAGTVVLLKGMDRRIAEHTHNDYLELWFEQGTIGFALFLLLITHGGIRFVITRLGLRRDKQIYNAFRSPAALNVTLMAAVTTILVNALTSFPLHMPARGTLAWILIGVFFAADIRMSEALAKTYGSKLSLPISDKDESQDGFKIPARS